jgi:hypothetical protein
MAIEVRKIGKEHDSWARELILSRYRDGISYGRGTAVNLLEAEKLVAVDENDPKALLCYTLGWSDMQIVALEDAGGGEGAARALIERAVQTAKDEESKVLTVALTNDNLEGMILYQLSGFRLSAVKRGSIDEARRKNPDVPLKGKYGILVRDEIELSIKFGG